MSKDKCFHCGLWPVKAVGKEATFMDGSKHFLCDGCGTHLARAKDLRIRSIKYLRFTLDEAHKFIFLNPEDRQAFVDNNKLNGVWLDEDYEPSHPEQAEPDIVRMKHKLYLDLNDVSDEEMEFELEQPTFSLNLNDDDDLDESGYETEIYDFDL